MKKKSGLLIIAMLLSTVVISLMNLNTINAKADTPFNPPPAAPNDQLKWDFENGTIIGWNLKAYDGGALIIDANLKYNISNIALMNASDIGWYAYLVQLKEVYWNFSKGEFEEFVNITQHPILNCSGVNVTTQDDFFSVSKIGGGLELFCTPFIPLNGSTLMLDWCGERLKNDYGYYLQDADPILTTSIAADNNLIMLENSTLNGEYVRMIFYDNGTLKTGELNSTFYGMFPAGVRYNYTRIVNVKPHGADNYWNFNKDELIGWRMEGGMVTITDIIYNITDNETISDPMKFGYDYEGIELTPMYFNASTNQLEYFTNQTEHPILNSSLIQYDLEMMEPFDMFGLPGILGPYIYPFIPTNDSGVLDLHWCANAMVNSMFTAYILEGVDFVFVDPVMRNIFLMNSSSGAYIDMYYLADGTLDYGEIFGPLGGPFVLINYTRIYDYNPFDDIGDWAVSIGSVFYMGFNDNETKFEIVDIVNVSIDAGFMLAYNQQVLANVSVWNATLQVWIQTDANIIVGSATEEYPLFFMGSGIFPVIVPIGTPGSEIAKWLAFMLPMISDFDGLEYGSNWIKITNSTTGGYGLFEFFSNGLIKKIYVEGIEFMGSINRTTVIYYKNSTILLSGTHQFDIDAGLDFSVSVDIALDQDSLLLFAAIEDNPFNVTLDDGVLFIDIMLNHTDNLDNSLEAPLNITIIYDDTLYDPNSIEIWWFNYSANNGKGEWVSIEFTDLGNGILLISINHTSVFAMSGLESEDKKKKEEDTEPGPGVQIPFGNYYLVFMAVAIIGLLVYKKRRL